MRLCREEGVPLVNIVRRPEHVAALRAEVAQHVCASISLIDPVRPAVVAQYSRVASGAKFVIEPQRG